MKIIDKDESGKILKLRIETPEDLWTIYEVIKPNDEVYARTSRELKTRSGSKRKSMMMGISVIWARFQSISGRLRIHGYIINAPKELDLIGQRHTISLRTGSIVTIVKKKGWKKEELEKIIEACKRVRIRVLAVGLDDESVCIALIKNYEVDVIKEEGMNLPGKAEPEKRRITLEKKLRRIAQLILEISRILNVSSVILAGPGILKNNLANLMKKEELKIYIENTSIGGIEGIYEAIRREALDKILKETQIAEEERLMNELLRRIANGEYTAVYTIERVRRAAEFGAIDTLMLTCDMISKSEEIRRVIEEIIREVEKKRGKVKIFSSRHVTRVQLEKLGGIAALLKFPIPES